MTKDFIKHFDDCNNQPLGAELAQRVFAALLIISFLLLATWQIFMRGGDRVDNLVGWIWWMGGTGNQCRP